MERACTRKYSGPHAYRGKRVVIVGSGNSGAQIVAEITEPDSGLPMSREQRCTRQSFFQMMSMVGSTEPQAGRKPCGDRGATGA